MGIQLMAITAVWYTYNAERKLWGKELHRWWLIGGA
jgi:hypothetical protein